MFLWYDLKSDYALKYSWAGSHVNMELVSNIS
jgi:hypothetical protein